MSNDPSAPARGDYLRLSGVVKTYRDATVLAGIDLTIAPRERVVICGPSGSGKSTLIRCISGLEGYDHGEIVVLGKPLAPHPQPDARLSGRVGMVFQSFNLFPHKTILENCTLAPRQVLGLSREAAQERALTHLRRLHIGEHAAKKPAQLSGGQQQRAAIARALCMQPEILLFDEPTSALDPEMADEVLDAMVDLADLGITIVCVTHELAFARRIADRVIFLDQGRIVEAGPPEVLFTRPQTPRLQRFLSRVPQRQAPAPSLEVQ
ncbi:amino acid ABC transporter ATP-binding protein [Paraburkholderia sp. BCC1886]|uniref:amino acid ABC transporter ATP-binding protein n=1 Tax=Paraburkholderia sp. BCC1886 TaxID=2562670 RepID=UPI001182A1D9|nr:amino acid ABC transporter ATP-binding protein [Paraburkholderia sp. BCC1886]